MRQLKSGVWMQVVRRRRRRRRRVVRLGGLAAWRRRRVQEFISECGVGILRESGRIYTECYDIIECF